MGLVALAAVVACGGKGTPGPDDNENNNGGNGGNGGQPGVVPVIVFDMVVGGNRDIYSVKADGSALTRLTTAAVEDRHPTAAGQRVVFMSAGENGRPELFSVSLASKLQARLTDSPNFIELDPALSPDGKRLAYSLAVTTEEGSATKIVVADWEAVGAKVAAPAFGFAETIESSASWAPDSKRLVFVSTTNGTADLFVMDLSGSEPVVTPFQVADGAQIDPAWSPDGSTIAFASSVDGNTDIYVAPATGGTPTRLTTRAGADGSPTWLADGRIAFIAFEGNASRLRIVDPKAPDQITDVNIAEGSPMRPAGVR